jgi:membrane associated rhomboid family serine protease
MVVANVLWFIVGLAVAVRLGVPVGRYLWSGEPAVLHRLGAVTAADLVHGEWWRLATCCFVHVGVLHLLGNMFALGMMGPLAELLWGRGRMLVIYAVSGLAGSCLAMAVHPLGETGAPVLLAGASGAIWGVLGSLVAWVLLFRPYLPAEVAADLSRRLMVVVVLNVGVSLLPDISWEAHLGGGVAGFVAAGLLNAARFGGRSRRAWALVALALLPVACAGGLAAMAKVGGRWEPVRYRIAADVEAAYASAFRRDVGPLLDALTPEATRPVEQQAIFLLLRDPGKRNPNDVAAVRAKIESLRATAANAEVRTGGPPTGAERIDRRRERARAFAAARRKSFDLLLGMLGPAQAPDPPALRAWGDARREADRLWEELVKT